MFKPKQEVIILKLYNLRTDGAGRIVKLLEYGENKGRYLIDTPAGLVAIEPERLVDAKEYWAAQRKERDSQ